MRGGRAATIRLPVHVHDMLNSIKKHTRELTEELGRTPSEEEIAARMDLTMKKLRFLRDASRPAMSMEATRQAARVLRRDDDLQARVGSGCVGLDGPAARSVA